MTKSRVGLCADLNRRPQRAALLSGFHLSSVPRLLAAGFCLLAACLWVGQQQAASSKKPKPLNPEPLNPEPLNPYLGPQSPARPCFGVLYDNVCALQAVPDGVGFFELFLPSKGLPQVQQLLHKRRQTIGFAAGSGSQPGAQYRNQLPQGVARLNDKFLVFQILLRLPDHPIQLKQGIGGFPGLVGLKPFIKNSLKPVDLIPECICLHR